MNRVAVYIHGNGGSPEEANHYAELFPDCDVVGMEYSCQYPWEAAEDFPKLMDAICRGYDSVILIANSIGAYFAMVSGLEPMIDKAFFISPVVDMEKLILNMMNMAGVTEEELREQGEIETESGEILSWRYLSYARKHPVRWNAPTHIIYGEKDELTSLKDISDFAMENGATLTIMKDGEHWFHTEEQMQFLDNWIIPYIDFTKTR